jgi:pimeloyl-ACP methyl ester carboxylesterase
MESRVSASRKPAALFAVSKDGVRVAYDVTGEGPVLLLLPGGGQSRHVWHELGYVGRLSRHFTVVTQDIRGNGESDKPTAMEAYAIDRHIDDVLSVADAVGAPRFSVWGYSYGGNIGRYLPAYTDRVARLVMIGIQFGAAAPDKFREYALGLKAKWTPAIEAHRAGTLDVNALSEADRLLWQRGIVESTVAQLSALCDWPGLEPRDLRCPTLWVVGTANDNAMASVKNYQQQLIGTTVTLHLLAGLTHEDELARIDDVLAPMRDFMLSLG